MTERDSILNQRRMLSLQMILPGDVCEKCDQSRCTNLSHLRPRDQGLPFYSLGTPLHKRRNCKDHRRNQNLPITIQFIWTRMACHKPCEPGDTRADVQMKGEDVVIGSGLQGYLSRPSGQPKGGIIMMADIFGYAFPANRAVADNVAAKGYVCLVPDLFRGDPWNPEIRGNPIDRSRPTGCSNAFEKWLESLQQDRVDQDMDSSLEYLKNSLKITSVGVIGFCWGGLKIMQASRKSADKFKAAVGFYAVKFVPNMAEVALAMKTPTLLLLGELDDLMPIDTVAEMENALKAANRLVTSANDDDSQLDGAAARIKVFPGVGHAFAHRGDRSDPAITKAAVESFDDMYEWLAKYM